MLLQITNTCLMECPHCMDCSSNVPQHMSRDIEERALSVCEHFNASTIVVSGGEPTMHPEWERIVRSVASRFRNVVITTNGSWLGTDSEKTMVKLIEELPNLRVQITSVRELYKDYKRVRKGITGFRNALSRARCADANCRVCFEEDFNLIKNKMMCIGRASTNERFRKMAREVTKSTTSCFPNILVAVQIPLRDTLANLEQRGFFCHPLIDWKGNMHWSESWLCPSFACVSEDFDTIESKARSWRPCGRCEDFKRLIRKAKVEPKYAIACTMLGIHTNGR